jgi:cytochrome b
VLGMGKRRQARRRWPPADRQARHSPVYARRGRLRVIVHAATIATMPAPADLPTPAARIRVWDLPTRLFHWLLAAAVLVALSTGWWGDSALVWHMRCGQVVMALLLFRLVWGLVGGRWSRFASFIYAPATVLRYLRGQTRSGEHLDVGHNPLGSLSVFAVLGFLVLQVMTGTVADDEISTRGPLNGFVSNALALSATSWHKSIGKWVLMGLVVLHIAAIAFYLLRKHHNLIAPMLHGDKSLPANTPASVDTRGTRALALALLLACAALAFWVGTLGA